MWGRKAYFYFYKNRFLDLIRWLVYIFARNLTINCEVEAWYIWELLPQQVIINNSIYIIPIFYLKTLASGDITFYLTTLFSSIHTLKNPESLNRLKYSQDFSSMGSQTVCHNCLLLVRLLVQCEIF